MSSVRTHLVEMSMFEVLFLGCSPDYTSECRDKSDDFDCTDSTCRGNEGYFPCSDGKYCIWKALVCDGYTQCEDESGNFL